MEEIFKGCSVDEILLYGIFTGMLFNVIDNMIYSFMDYLKEKSWLVRDYERIIYEYNKGSIFESTQEDLDIENEAIKNYEKRLEKRKNIEKFLNKFRRNKNEN